MKKIIAIISIIAILLASCSPGSGSWDSDNPTGQSMPNWMKGKWTGTIKLSGDIPTTSTKGTFVFDENGLDSASGLDYVGNVKTTWTSTGCTVKVNGSENISGMKVSYSGTYKFTKTGSNKMSLSGTINTKTSISGHTTSGTVKMSGSLSR